MKRTIRDYDLSFKKVIIRCDFNVPMEKGQIVDDTRIKTSLDTINYALSKNAKVIIFSHLGKVKKDEDKIKNTLLPVSLRLKELLKKEVKFSPWTSGEDLKRLVENLNYGEVLLVENTRFEDLDGKKESGNDNELSKFWASLGDVFINDAYGTLHRAHASNVGIASILPNGIGFLVEEESKKIDEFLNKDIHPFVVIMGGAKVHDKIGVIENLITKCDKLLLGGGMAYTFLKAKGLEIGKSLLDEESIDFCKEMLEKHGEKIVLPIDIVASDSIDASDGETFSSSEIPSEKMGVDIGVSTISFFKKELSLAKKVFFNGPLGVIENNSFEKGTKSILEFLSEIDAKVLIGGGDIVAAVNKYNLKDKYYHVSTGGGATLEYLEGKILPGLSVIEDER